MISRMRELRDRHKSFAFETTMASRSIAPFLRECSERGYFIESHYFALDTPERAIARVQHRVELGGHNVPEDIIKRRFWAGRANFLNLYIPLSDAWVWYDSVSEPPRALAWQKRWDSLNVLEPELWQSFVDSVKKTI